jgi:hypothetical protein
MSHIGTKGMRGVTFRQFMYAVMESRRKQSDFLNLTTMTQSWTYLEADRAQYVGRFEDLLNETVRILQAIMPDVTRVEIMHGFAKAGVRRRAPRPNGKPYGDWRQYYALDLRRWVASNDKGLIERYGYTFD